MRTLLLLLLLFFSCHLVAQEEKEDLTELEMQLSIKGKAVVKEYIPVGKFATKTGLTNALINVSVLKLSTISGEPINMYVYFSAVDPTARINSVKTALLPFDEVDNILQFLQYLEDKAQQPAKTESDFEYSYTSNSDFKITLYNNKDKGSWALNTQFGRYLSKGAFQMNVSTIPELYSLLAKAKTAKP